MSSRAPESVLWDFLRGAMMTRALGLVADLDVAGALSGGPRHSDEVARHVGAEPDTLYRILRALATDGVFVEVEPRVFANTPVSELLHEPSKRAFAHLFAGVWHRAVGELTADTVAAPFPRTYGTDFWAWLAKHPEERAAFDVAMVDGNSHRVERLASVDWRGDETVVDVGGGNGSLLVEFLRERPGLRGIVFDLPETVRDPASFGDRVEFVPGSFFERVPCGDVYILATILHDWDDENATAILQTIRGAAAPDSRLLILDGVVQPGSEAGGAKWLDLLVLTLFAGRERDDQQWRALLADGGFEPLRIADGLIEARCR